MKDCCINFMGGGISTIYYCSGNLWNATLNTGKPILCRYCPVCGKDLFEVACEYPELAEARGMKLKKVKG